MTIISSAAGSVPPAKDPVSLLQSKNAAEEGVDGPNNLVAGSTASGSRRTEFLDTPAETLYYRYGFKLSPSVSPSMGDLSPMTVCHFLGDAQWTERFSRDTSADCDIQNHISTFFRCLSRAQKLGDVPTELYELQQQGAAPLRPSRIQLRWELIDGTTYYFLMPKSPVPDGTMPESIVVRSASSAVEILRRDWTTMEQVALNLVARGISFNTFSQAPPRGPRPNPHPVQSYRGLGLRPKTFQAKDADYTGYEAIRNRIFCSGRGRAALMMGGIIARLARDVVSPQSVCRGPTKDVYVDGRCIWDGHASSPAYWDDALTDEELEIICGLYEVSTGNGEQTKYVSWWPPHTAWHFSGINIGYWTPACEDWFQRRLAQIHAGEAQLQTRTQWRHNMTYEVKCSPLSFTNDRLAAEFLTQNGTRITRTLHAQQFPKAIHAQDMGLQDSSNGFYFTLRTQQPDSPNTEETFPQKNSCNAQATSQAKQTPEIQQLTREYWDGRRKISSLVLRGNAIEQRLRSLHVSIPGDIDLDSSELAKRLVRAETELAEARNRSREAEHILDDIQRECKTPSVVPMLLQALIEE
ncbi:hypothetical protein C8R44DRAFT_989000 [Mycena epipterygia]|nr:hypothetical protein C8R44DRAFT_989000 [Mycena epipterygia]